MVRDDRDKQLIRGSAAMRRRPVIYLEWRWQQSECIVDGVSPSRQRDGQTRFAGPSSVHNERLAIYTLVRNRRHSNVAFLLGESLRYEPEKDTLSIVPRVATLYPNFRFTVTAEQLPAFTAALADEALGDRAVFVEHVVARLSVRRSSPEFWARFHSIIR